MDVLVVDDEDPVRELMLEILTRAGWGCEGAATAEDALAVVDVRDVALVVTDALMPHFSGFELVQELRRRRPELPVVVVTGATTEQTIAEAHAAGATAVLTKPFSHAELVAVVRSAIG